MTCDTCGHELQIGDFPFCPHQPGAQSVIGDDIPGGMWVENGFPEPVKVYSHSEHERLLAQEGCEIRAMNRGDQDKICRRWDAPDAVTLANAAVLVSRGVEARRAKAQRWPDATMEITATDGESFTGKDLA